MKNLTEIVDGVKKTGKGILIGSYITLMVGGAYIGACGTEEEIKTVDGGSGLDAGTGGQYTPKKYCGDGRCELNDEGRKEDCGNCKDDCACSEGQNCITNYESGGAHEVGVWYCERHSSGNTSN